MTIEDHDTTLCDKKECICLCKMCFPTCRVHLDEKEVKGSRDRMMRKRQVRTKGYGNTSK